MQPCPPQQISEPYLQPVSIPTLEPAAQRAAFFVCRREPSTRRHGIVEPGRLLRRRCERHSALMCAAFRPQHRPRASSQRCEHVIDAVDRLLLLRRSLRPSPSRWQCLGACGGCTGSAFGVLGLRRDASWSVRTPRCSGTPQRGGDGSVPCNRCSANARCSRRPRAWRRRCGHDEASA